MIKRAFIFSLAMAIFSCSMNTAIAAQQKKKSSGIIKKAVAAYVVYRVVKHYKDKKEEQKAKAGKDEYIESYYDEDCLDEDECEEE
ncbi:hypothetical protein [Haemophilus haemolyticus]|uniref:Uncharacterized protein n=1 Tax=Haemophilus haemolyticus TaxID=726 RepID=A0AAQ1YNF4_HAEHA|nr:hypothetical protein [Haemophilus haemolyticus]TDN43301.1 hypothetical protein EGH31_0367 [Haemophilus haemolyticus]